MPIPREEEEDTCRHFGNPLIIPIFKARINHEQCYPEEAPEEAAEYVAPRQEFIFQTRSDIFYEHQKKKKAKGAYRDRDVNFGYLPLNEDIKSIGDLMDLDSAEIALPRSKSPPEEEPVRLWEVDDVKSFSTPELLPDVILNENQRKTDSKSNLIALDPEQVKLGRFVVDDDPPPQEPVHKREIVDRKQRIVGDTSYKTPSIKVPEVILTDITPQEDKEPDFMEQLEKIKLAARTIPPPVDEGDIKKEIIEVIVKSGSHIGEPVITHTVRHSAHPESKKSNAIHKEGTKTRRHRRRKHRSRRRNRKRGRKNKAKGHVVVYPHYVEEGVKHKSKKSHKSEPHEHHEKKTSEVHVHTHWHNKHSKHAVANTSTRFYDHEQQDGRNAVEEPSHAEEAVQNLITPEAEQQETLSSEPSKEDAFIGRGDEHEEKEIASPEPAVEEQDALIDKIEEYREAESTAKVPPVAEEDFEVTNANNYHEEIEEISRSPDIVEFPRYEEEEVHHPVIDTIIEREEEESPTLIQSPEYAEEDVQHPYIHTSIEPEEEESPTLVQSSERIEEEVQHAFPYISNEDREDDVTPKSLASIDDAAVIEQRAPAETSEPLEEVENGIITKNGGFEEGEGPIPEPVPQVEVKIADGSSTKDPDDDAIISSRFVQNHQHAEDDVEDKAANPTTRFSRDVKNIPNTTTRFCKNEETFLDELLSVV